MAGAAVEHSVLAGPLRWSTFGGMRCLGAAQPLGGGQASQFSTSVFHAERATMVKAGNHGEGFQPGPDRSRFRSSMQIEDFEVGETSHRGQLEVTDEMAKQRHPLEYAAEGLRRSENPYSRMNEKSLLIANFPKDMNVTEAYIKDLCLKHGGENVMIKQIHLQEAMSGGSKECRERTAYAVVEFELEKWVPVVRRALRKLWVEDRLLKVKTIKDQKEESHKERTVVAHGIPSHLDVQHLAAAFARFGAVTTVELPTVDRVVQQQLADKGLLNDHFAKQRQMKADQEYRYAQIVLRDAQNVDVEFQNVLEQSWGKEKAREVIQQQKDVQSEFTQFDMLDEERVQSFTRVLAALQSEGLQIEDSKATLGVLLKDLQQLQESESATSLSSARGAATEHGTAIEGKKEQIMSTLKYLVSNKESLDEAQLSFINIFNQQDSAPVASAQQIGDIDPIHKLQRMTLAEVANAYDHLLGILKAREELIKKRIKSSLQHFGTEERILFESGDFNREQESVPDVLRNLLRMDEHAIDKYLGINEQIKGVELIKNLPVEEKLYQWFTGTADWTLEKNFNRNQLAFAATEEFGAERLTILHNSRATRSAALLDGTPPAPFLDEYRAKIAKDVQRVREETDTPFDEIYHKERKLVQDIIRAQKAIEELQRKQPNPAASMKFDPKDIEEDPEFGDLYGSMHEDQFIRDKRAQDRAEAQAAKRDLDSADIEHQYRELEQEKIEDLIASGQINREEFEIAKAMSLQNRQTNLGYALVTFSHADEAKLCNMMAASNFYINMTAVDVLPKGNLDHSELDKSYFMKKLQNESELTEQRQELRDARAKLRDFEQNMDDELPDLKKLKEFRSIAQEMIENPKHKTRRHQSNRRTKRETEELYEKLKAYEAANPGINLTSLFESEQIEKARLRMHKKAFQSYKDFEFLKAGITKPKKDKRGQAKESDVFEPFNYPGLKDTVSEVLVDGIQPRMANRGGNLMADSSTRKRFGRRFDRYTEQEFLESYLGKDFARAADLDANTDNWTFGFQTPIKELFPDRNEFLTYPKLLEEQEQLKELVGIYRQDGKALDEGFATAMDDVDATKFTEDHVLEHRIHPRDRSRTYLGDLKKAMETIRQKQISLGKPNEVDMRDITKVLDELDAEYASNPFSNKLDPKRELQMKHMEEQEARVEAAKAALEAMGDSPEQAVWAADAADGSNYMDRLQQRLIKAASEYDEGDNKIADLLADDANSRGSGSYGRFGGSSGNQQRPQRQRGGQGDGPGGRARSGPGSSNSQRRGFGTDNKKSQDAVQADQAHQEVDGMMLEVDSMGGDFGSKESRRRSNENLYNIQHAAKMGRLNEDQHSLKPYKDAAAAITAARRQHFDRLREQQLALPKAERIPHYLDAEGIPRPYTLKMLERDGGPVPTPTGREHLEEEDLITRLNRELREREDRVTGRGARRDASEDGQVPAVTAPAQPLNPEQAAIKDLRSRYFDVLEQSSSEAIPDLTVAEYLALFKDDAPIHHQAIQDPGSSMYRYQQTYMDESDLARHKFRTAADGSTRTLDEFQDEQESIYDEYRKQAANPDGQSRFDALKQESLEQKQRSQALGQLYSEARDNLVEPPDFTTYFDREAEGQSPYGQRQTRAEEDQEADDQFNRILEEEDDELNYRKELLARMYGGKLTARQYGVLMNQPEHDAKANRDFQKMNDYKTMINARDEIRIGEEAVETYRREQVVKGEWSEAESYTLLQEKLNELYEKYPTKRAFERKKKEERELMERLAEARTSTTLFEREYYFDEGLGESLNDHIANLKKQFEGVTVETRRDRDGFAIVKLSMAPKFKYNLDEILQQDPAEAHRIQLENHEAVLKEFMPAEPRAFAQEVSDMNSKNNEKPADYLNIKGYELFQTLMEERYHGKYKDDLDGFVRELQHIKKHYTGKGEPAVSDLPRGLDPSNLAHKALLAQRAASELEGDSATFDFEIQYQLKLKQNEFLNFQKRSEADFVKPTRSENLQFREQVQTLEETTQLLEKDNEWLLQAGDANQNTDDDRFDLQKYKELKRTIKARREAKEQILKQGFPEFKPYLRL